MPEQHDYNRPLPELINGPVRISWCYLGEGYGGDYDEEDSLDTPLLRYDIALLNAKGEWEDVDNGSYCTLMPLDAGEEQLTKALEYMMYQLKDAVIAGTHKRIAESLSWIEYDSYPNVTWEKKFATNWILTNPQPPQEE